MHKPSSKTITVSRRERPIAEIRPLADAERKLAQRLRRMEDRGVVLRSAASAVAPALVKRRPGALRRFLAQRDV